MKVSEKQLLIMLKVLEGSLSIKANDGTFGYSDEVRKTLYNQIINQQSDELKEVGPE